VWPHLSVYINLCIKKGKVNGKAVPLQAWSGPESSRKLRFPNFMTTAQDGVKVKVKQSRYRPGVAQKVPGS